MFLNCSISIGVFKKCLLLFCWVSAFCSFMSTFHHMFEHSYKSCLKIFVCSVWHPNHLGSVSIWMSFSWGGSLSCFFIRSRTFGLYNWHHEGYAGDTLDSIIVLQRGLIFFGLVWFLIRLFLCVCVMSWDMWDRCSLTWDQTWAHGSESAEF